MRLWRRLVALLLGLTLATAGLAGCGQTTPTVRASSSQSGSSGSASTDPQSGLPVVALASLPPQAAHTMDLIRSNGPFPYHQDGVVYHNNNRVLPRERDGYYDEYTVPTPGSSSRGARRIITGQGGQFYWTADHYDSFQRIA